MSPHSQSDLHHQHQGSDQHGRRLAIDPVCGMSVDPATAKHHVHHAGQDYYFCSSSCREKFLGDPQKYVGGAATVPAEAVAEGTIYTCPMHPQIRQVGPGNCPICGMALEPEMPSSDAGPNRELMDMTRRFWVGVVLSVPVVAVETGSNFINLHQWIGAQTLNWVQLVLATPVVLWAGWPFFERGWASIKTRA